MVSLAPETSNGYTVNVNPSGYNADMGGFSYPTSYYNPVNFGNISANPNSTAVTPGAPQQSNNNLNNIFNKAQDAYKGLNYLNGLGSQDAISSLGMNAGNALASNGASTLGGAAGSLFSENAAASSLGSASGELLSGGSSLGSLGGALGGAGFGFAAGGFLSSLVGGNKLGGSIGGALGGAIGAATLGGLSGVTMGATLGSVVPGIGTVIGAGLGSLIGGMFGGKKTPHPASGINYTGGLGADGTLAGGIVGSKHISGDIGQSLGDDFQSYLKNQAKTYGIEYKGITGALVDTDQGYYGSPGTIVLSKDPNYSKKVGIGIGNTPKTSNDLYEVINYDPNNAQSKADAYQKAFNYAATQAGLDPTKLTPAATTAHTTNINVNQNSGPSDWDTFLANYRQQHPQVPNASPTN